MLVSLALSIHSAIGSQSVQQTPLRRNRSIVKALFIQIPIYIMYFIEEKKKNKYIYIL